MKHLDVLFGLLILSTLPFLINLSCGTSLCLCEEILEIAEDHLGFWVTQVIGLPIAYNGIENPPTSVVTNK